MGKENIVIDLASTVVANADNNFKATHIALGKALINAGDKDNAQKEINILKAEDSRTDPKGKWDEEEQILGNLNRKK